MAFTPRTVIIMNLPDDTQTREIYNLCAYFVGYASSWLARTEKGPIGFVQFATQQQACSMMWQLMGHPFTDTHKLHTYIAGSNEEYAVLEPYVEGGATKKRKRTPTPDSDHDELDVVLTEQGDGPPAQRNTVRIWDLNPKLAQDEIRTAVTTQGPPGVLDLRLVHQDDGLLAFVDYDTEEGALCMVSRGLSINGYKARVSMDGRVRKQRDWRDPDAATKGEAAETVHIGELDAGVRDSDIADATARHTHDGAREVRMVPGRDGKRGQAFVDLYSREDADSLLRAFPRHFVCDSGRGGRVEVSRRKPERRDRR